MAVKNNAVVGHIECPLCNGNATVHSCMVGRGRAREALYIRCGTVSNGCGCIQPYGPTGQAFIRDRYRPIDAPAADPAPAPGPEPVADPAPAANGDEYTPGEPAETDQKPKRRGFLSALLSEE
ncbi:hypothetical protein [Alloalcanivorax mobilis]|uniref:hypothetical protein n=1 Tax=Alloalcanivorax mobilis TaxID=2019569 RepID=UPI000C774A95|nr:hypothetical protein [Alloalcanivorax mobilis]